MPLNLAGLTVDHDDALEIAATLDRDDPGLAHRLRDSVETGADEVTLEIPDRDTILLALDDERDSNGLAQLRAALLADHVERRRLGL